MAQDMELMYQKYLESSMKNHPETDFVSYVTERGMSYESAIKLLKTALADMEKNVANESKRTYVMPNHRAAAATYRLRVDAYKKQLVVLETLREDEIKLEKQVSQVIANEPLGILNEMQTPKREKPDYTRAIIIGGIVFTGLMLLLIWRIRK